MRARLTARKTPNLIDDTESKVQREVISALVRAFAEVSRKGGVSWSESIAMDAWADASECALARASDRDGRWEDVANDPAWDLGGDGGWAFLDPIGMRYYLPAALVRLVRDPAAQEIGLDFLRYTLECQPQRRGRDLALLTPKQRTAVALALRFLAEAEAIRLAPYDSPFCPWRELYETQWRGDDPDASPGTSVV